MEGLLRGVYYEFIAFPCGAEYSMPLGVFQGEVPEFRVFPGTGLYRLLREGFRDLYLLAPVDPLNFYRSINHEIEGEIRRQGNGCPAPDQSLGAWYYCAASPAGAGEGYDLYLCREFKHLSGCLPGYTRVSGCLVELMVILTKLQAGVAVEGAVGYAEWLNYCVERASRGSDRYVRVSNELLQAIKGLAGEG